jgi:hypothetical protein
MCRWPLGDPRDEKFSFCGDGMPFRACLIVKAIPRLAYQAAGRARTLQAEDFEAAVKSEEVDEVQETKTAAKKR